MRAILGTFSDVASATSAIRALGDAHVETDDIAVTGVGASGAVPVPIETKSGGIGVALAGGAAGLVVGVALTALFHAGALPAPGVGLVASGLVVTAGRVLSFCAGIGALTGYIMGLAMWRLELRADGELDEVRVSFQVSERRAPEMRALLERCGALRVDAD